MRTRRSLLGAVGAAGVAGLAGCSGDDPADGQDGDERQTSTAPDGTTDGDASDWRQRDGRPARTGSNTAMSGLTDAPSSEVLYEPDDVLGVEGEPAVEDGQLYFFTSERLIAVSTDGQQQWEFGVSDPGGTPAVLDGTVFFSGNDSLVAVSGGERQWAQSVSFDHQPVVTEDAIYVRADFSIRSYTLDGDQRWEQSVDGSSNQPAVEGSTVYHQKSRNGPDTLYARSASDGSVEWSAQVGGDFGVPVVADGTVYGTRFVSGDDSGTAVIAVSDGSVQWESEPVGVDIAGHYPIVGDESVFIAGIDGVQALDTADGTTQWDSPYVTSNRGSRLQPRVDADSVYIMEGPSLVAINRENGQQRWATEIGDDDVEGFCPAGRSVYAAGEDLYELS